MDQITHTMRYSRWKDIILQCQNRLAGMSIKQWMGTNENNFFKGTCESV
jgi:hypothetical protein